MVLAFVIVGSLLGLAVGLGWLMLRLKPDRVRVVATVAKFVHLELDIQATSAGLDDPRKSYDRL